MAPGISRGVHKLARTPSLSKKKKKREIRRDKWEGCLGLPIKRQHIICRIQHWRPTDGPSLVILHNPLLAYCYP